jgi:hypothetical protein
MTKTLNQIIFFFLHQIQNIFFSNIANQNGFFLETPAPPSLQVKWSVPKTNDKNDHTTTVTMVLLNGYSALIMFYRKISVLQGTIFTYMSVHTIQFLWV